MTDLTTDAVVALSPEEAMSVDGGTTIPTTLLPILVDLVITYETLKAWQAMTSGAVAV